MLKISFYYIPCNLGHTQKVFNLIKAFKRDLKEKVSILLFCNKSVCLRHPFSQYAELCILPDSGEEFAEVLKERISLIIKCLGKFRPDIFITEYYPFGQDVWSKEVPHVLDFIKRKIKSRILLSIGYLIWKEGALDILTRFYDGILCHFPKRYLDEYLVSDYASKEGKELIRNMVEYFKDNILFTGFVLDKEVLNLVQSCSQSNDILVSRGGSREQDKKEIIGYSLKIACDFPGYNFLCLVGAYCNKNEFSFYNKLAGKKDNVIIKKYIDNFSEIAGKSILNISMAGYNTVAELLWMRKKCLMLPYHTEEQLFRASFINKYYDVPVLFPGDLALSKFKSNIEELLEDNKRPNVKKEDFLGCENLCSWANSY